MKQHYSETLNIQEVLKDNHSVVENKTIFSSIYEEQSTDIDKISIALAKAQNEMTSVLTNKTGQTGFLKYKYATLSQVVNLANAILPKNNISYSHQIVFTPRVLVVTKLMHENQWLRSVFPADLFMSHPEYFKTELRKFNIIQDTGSAITYAKRYSLASLIGVAIEEDDNAQSLSIQTQQKLQIQNQESLKKHLASLCKIDNINVKDFVSYHKIESNDEELILSAVQNYQKLKDAFLCKSTEVA